MNSAEGLCRNNERKIATGFDTMEVNGDFVKICFHKIVRAEVRLVSVKRVKRLILFYGLR